jgi:hypothetical protein
MMTMTMTTPKKVPKSDNRMSDKQRPRIVVLALDTTPGKRTLETALNLAALMQARVEGLFVEDIDLLRLATLPFAREIVSISAQMRPIASDALEKEMRSLALQVQRQLAREAEARQLEWGFSVVRDRLLRAARAAASDADLFIVQNPHLHQRGPATTTIGVVYDGFMAPIDIAAQLAQGGAVRVLLSKQFENARNDITKHVTTLGAHPVFITLRDNSAAAIGEVARHQHLTMLMLPNTVAVDDTALQPLLESAPCTVVVKEHSGH